MTNNTQNQNHIPPTYNAQDKLAPLETIVQWNINSYYKKLPDIHRIIANLHLLALCIQETNLKNQHKKPKLKNYHGYFKNQDPLGRASGGVGIFVSSSTEHEQIPLTTPLEAIAIFIKTNYITKLSICNVYALDSTGLTLSDLKNLISQLSHPLMVISTFRNIIWGSYYTDRRGRTVEKLL
ncbi:Endonuclease/exonuclease/phosphatase [Cinara cedri]|uniref:Endonuclease/exonuclease/phosphatase n=1 Tax=Cinara cedri TaxID=506608 RepID=A0A5E4N8G6_9HEMI|nr:Endonuclease/exonuclease/phosphatase [Cinara cedri]